MKLFEKLKIDGRRLAIDSRKRSYETMLQTAPRPGRKGSASYMFRASDPCGIALAAYLNDDIKLSREYAQEAVTNIHEWFYGIWSHDPNDKSDSEGRAIKNWIDRYRQGVFWASTLGDWSAVRRFSDFPGNDLSDESERKSEAPWYLLLASYLRQTNPSGDPKTVSEIDRHAGDQLPSSGTPESTGTWWAGIRLKQATFEELVEHDSRKRIKLLATVLQAIYQRKQSEFADSLIAYLRYYRKSEFPRSDAIDEKQSLDGTILYHVGQRAGLVIKISDEISDYIVRLLKLKGTRCRVPVSWVGTRRCPTRHRFTSTQVSS